MAKRALRSKPGSSITPQAKRRKLSQNVHEEEKPQEDQENQNVSDAEEAEEYDIEKIHLKNIRENAAFLQELGLNKDLLDFANSHKKPKASQNGLKPEKRERVILPPRKSLRLRRMDPEGGILPDLPVTPMWNDSESDNPRLPEGPLQMTEHLNNDFEEKEMVCTEFHKKLAKLKSAAKPKSSTDLQKFLKTTEKMTINEDRVAKVVPQRIFSLAIHPDPNCVLAVAGDKWGRIGFWNVGSKAGQDGVFSYRPHCRPVICLKFHPNNPGRLFSSSYDGTLRCADFEKAVFDEVYTTKEETDTRLNSFAFTSPETILVTNNYGEVEQIDCRSNTSGAENTWTLDNRSVKCVSVHPTQNHYFVIASNSGAVKMFDLRNLKKAKPVVTYQHWKSVDSAYFSPLTGRRILTTSMDDRIRLFDSSDLTPSDAGRCIASASHNNHTGRWLSNFRADWHPQREDVFVVGSMARPRRIELFDDSCKIVKTFEDDMENLASVCSLNVFHPTRNILVGGNSSGRLHVFMD